MSSPYVTLNDRPLDQWKVTELKEELKKRKLTTRGLKEELIRRLDEAVRMEWQSSTKDADDDTLIGVPSDEAKEGSLLSEKVDDSYEIALETIDNEAPTDEGVNNDGRDTFVEAKVVEVELVHEVAEVQAELVPHVVAAETSVLENEAVVSGKPLSPLTNEDEDTAFPHGEGLPPSEEGAFGTQNEEVIHATSQIGNDDFKSIQSDSDVQALKYQVSEVDSDSGFQVTSNSVSAEPISVTENIELNVDVITGNNHVELDVKAELVQSSPSSVVPDSVDEKKQFDNTNGSGIDKSIDTADLGSEKLNLDRSSGDDSMDEDVLDTKQLDAEPEVSKGIDYQFPNQLEDDHVDVVSHDNIETEPADVDKKTSAESTSVKRKLPEPSSNDESVKKARRWNAGDLKSSEVQTDSVLPVITPKGLSEPPAKRFSGSDTGVNNEQPKERIVPPSSKPPTNSLKIDRFLRPFTLKAVQELLGRTGNVTSFWMDHIKTHCYVSYSSVEEAEKTRDSVYNLQWPPNGGRLLVAEFVDPQEVKARLDAPLTSPTMDAAPLAYQPQSSALPRPTPPHLPVQWQQPPLSSVPPPPPSNPFIGKERPYPAREHLPREQPLPSNDQPNLPPPPPLPEKVDPPMATLDDFFRKTKSSPRIYYLPLSDEQVVAKLRASGKDVLNQ